MTLISSSFSYTSTWRDDAESCFRKVCHRHKSYGEQTQGHHRLYLPGVHALSGCDTTSYLYGIGKVTTLKALNSGATLKLLGEEDVTMAEVVSDATSFISDVLWKHVRDALCCLVHENDKHENIQCAKAHISCTHFSTSITPTIKSDLEVFSR